MPYTGYNFAPLSVYITSITGHPDYAELDSYVLRNGVASIRDIKHIGYIGDNQGEIDIWPWLSTGQNVDGHTVPTLAGAHLVFGVWAKTSGASNGNPYSGARIGVDFYATALVGGISTFGEPYTNPTIRDTGVPCPENGTNDPGGWYNGHRTWIDFGHDDWTLLMYDYIIPTTFYGYIAGSTWPLAVACDSSVQIDTLVAWLDCNADPTQYEHAVWFSEPFMLFNPSGSYDGYGDEYGGGGGGGYSGGTSGGTTYLPRTPQRHAATASSTYTVTLGVSTEGGGVVA